MDANIATTEAKLTLHPTRAQDGFIVKVQPPAAPPGGLASPHVPCDVVLVVDVSGSMGSDAPAPMLNDAGEPSLEDFGLTVLDLVKHAARTSIETMNEGDRVGIVTFSHDAEVRSRLPSSCLQCGKNVKPRVF